MVISRVYSGYHWPECTVLGTSTGTLLIFEPPNVIRGRLYYVTSLVLMTYRDLSIRDSLLVSGHVIGSSSCRSLTGGVDLIRYIIDILALRTSYIATLTVGYVHGLPLARARASHLRRTLIHVLAQGLNKALVCRPQLELNCTSSALLVEKRSCLAYLSK